MFLGIDFYNVDWHKDELPRDRRSRFGEFIDSR